jgi:hypothetical protein
MPGSAIAFSHQALFAQGLPVLFLVRLLQLWLPDEPRNLTFLLCVI